MLVLSILDLSTLNRLLAVKTLKIETPETIRLSLQTGEWVALLYFSDAYSHIPTKLSEIPFSRPILLVISPLFWSFDSSNGVHMCGQRGQVNSSSQGYKDPLVPRRLVDKGSDIRILPPGHSIPQDLGWEVSFSKLELEPM